MRRLSRSAYQAAFPEEILLDGVRRYENICRLRLEVILSGAQKTEALLGDFEVSGSKIRPDAVSCRRCLHVSSLCSVSQGQASRMISDLNVEIGRTADPKSTKLLGTVS